MKMKRLSKYKDNSVLNTDSYDKRRFESIRDMSKGLQNIDKEADVPGFQPLLNDIWASLYKINPEIKDEVATELEMNKSFMKRIMDDQSYADYRAFTKLDDLSAAIGTVKFGEQTIKWIEKQQKENERMKDLMDEIQKQQQDSKNNKGSKNQLEQALSELNNQMQQSLQSDSVGFSQAMAQAMQETQNVKDNVQSLLGGSGSNDADMKKVPLRDQLELADSLSKNQKLKRVADWAGRFKSIARKRQKSRHGMASSYNGVTTGNDIEKLLPTELSSYMNSKTKLDFMRRFAEGETLQYEPKGKEELGKGPIVLCLDQSGSMRNLDTQSKGFALALMSIARRQKRDFCLILFSNTTKVYKYERGKITNRDMISLAQSFLNGGTNFTGPLTESLKVINESRFKKADILFVTDGEARLSESFIKNFNDAKKEKDFKVLSLVIGHRVMTVERFSDEIVSIVDFQDEKSFTAFEV